jgi:hypothetical protein
MKARVWPRIEPLALIAATLATAMAISYVWLIRQQGSQPLPWVLALLLPSLDNVAARSVCSPGQMESARSSKAMRS